MSVGPIGPRRGAARHEAAALAEGADRALPGGGAHRLHDHVHAALAGQPTHRRVPVLVVGVVDRDVGPELGRPLELLGRRGGGEHARPGELGDLDRRETDAADRPVDQDILARLDPRVGHEHPPGGAERDREARRLLEGIVLGQGDRLARRALHVLGQPARVHLAQHVDAEALRNLAVPAVLADAAAPGRVQHHAVTDAWPLHPGADRRDHPGDVAAGDVGERSRLAGHALAGEDVEGVERARADPHHHLAGPRDGIGPAGLVGQDLGASMAVDDDRAHGMPDAQAGSGAASSAATTASPTAAVVPGPPRSGVRNAARARHRVHRRLDPPSRPRWHRRSRRAGRATPA